MLQCGAAWRSVLQRVAVWCSMLQYNIEVLLCELEYVFGAVMNCSHQMRVAACCSVLQSVAACCSMIEALVHVLL